VDFQFLPFFERFAVYQELAGAEWPADCTRLTAWFGACAARPSYLGTRHTLDFHLEQQRRMTELRAAAGT
jgi:glutathione S-transferase